MRIGIGLPTTTADTGQGVVEWARRAEAGPFTSLGVLDRIVYDSLEPMTSLAAAAAVTSRVRLVSMVVIGPLRNTAVLAKQAATIDLLSGGRLTLGLSIGARHDDYRAAGIDPSLRGQMLSAQLAELRSIWSNSEVGPQPAQPEGPDVLVGGAGGAAMLRMAQSADGYVHGGGPPRAFASATARAQAAWEEAERPGQPQLWGQGFFALADPEAGLRYMRDYYAFTGSFAERIVAGTLTTPQAVKDFVRGYADAGCDELVLFPASGQPAELDRLAEVLA